MPFVSAAVLLLMIQGDEFELTAVRKPSGELELKTKLPLPAGAVAQATLERVIDKLDLAQRRIIRYTMEEKSSLLFRTRRDGEGLIRGLYTPSPGTYTVRFLFDETLFQSAAVQRELQAGRLRPWDGARTITLGEAKDHCRSMEASIPEIRKLINLLDVLIDKLDKPLEVEQALALQQEAENIYSHASALVDKTGLPGTAKSISITAEQILNFVRFSAKSVTKMSDPKPEPQAKEEPREEDEPPKPGTRPPSGQVGEKHAVGSQEAVDMPKWMREGAGGAPAPKAEPAKAEPSPYVERLRKLMNDLRWLHLREIALILIHRAHLALLEYATPSTPETDEPIQSRVETLATLDKTLSDGDEDSNKKYKEITKLDDRRTVQKALDQAGKAVAPNPFPEQGGEKRPVDELLKMLRELDEHIRVLPTNTK